MRISRAALLATTFIAGGPALTASLLFAPAAHAQAAGGPATAAPPTTTGPPPTEAADNTTNNQKEVVVTGSVLRRRLDDTSTPLTVVTADQLDKRGITTVQGAIQQLSANGSGNLPNSFTANGAFAAGASGASLRGLTTNSTLTLIDGLRAAYYPLADDGTRNFVDLNSIPDVIVDRIETLEDGASSTYGADAIAGVVNVITKKTYQGYTARAEGGGAQKGGAGEVNVQALAGHGDLNTDGYNVYLGVEYEHDDVLRNYNRGFPYNTDNLSSLCTASIVDGSRTCRTNGVANGLQFNNQLLSVGSTIAAVVRPIIPTTPGALVGGGTAAGDYRLLNPALGCGGLQTVTVNPSQATAIQRGAGGISAPVTLCQEDNRRLFNSITPDDQRFSVSFRGTKKFGDHFQAYVEANYYQNQVTTFGVPSALRASATPGSAGTNFRSDQNVAGNRGILLPVFVCDAGVNCNATNGRLNPNNPFASMGEAAQIFYRFGDITQRNQQFSQNYRLAAGVSGDFDLFGNWRYNIDGVANQIDLRASADGNIFIDHLLNAIATGAYNFVTPSANTAAVRNFISPTNNQYNNSKLYQIQGTLARDLFTLPGGPVQLGVTGSARYESIYNPSSNNDVNGATNRYLQGNPFGVIGARHEEAVGFEVNVPFIKQIEITGSGRYDNYSSGQTNFSPKVSGRIKPFADWLPAFDRITLRSSYSQGFRIPSIAETYALPTTGFVTASVPQSFNNTHNNDGYGQYSLGLTTLGTQGLRPEKSENFTAGVVLNPIRQVSLSLDFYRIKKTDVIIGADTAPAISAYYAGTPNPTPGVKIIADAPDPNFPDAQPRIQFVQSGFVNADEQTTSGYDIGATGRFNLPYGVTYTTLFDGTYVLRFNQSLPDGTVEHFAGTIGPYATTSASGTPKFRANWQNTLAYGPVTGTVTAYYTDGYQEEAEDNGAVTGDCLGGVGTGTPAAYRDNATPIVCKVKPFWDIDLHATYDLTRHFQFYVDVSNLFDRNAPYDPTTYGGYQYNPAWANNGIIGRYFKVGAKATF